MPKDFSAIKASPHCESGKRSIWVLRDPDGGKSEYHFQDINPEKKREQIHKLKVDSGFLPTSDTRKSDFLFIREEHQKCSIVELKGSDLVHAFKQIFDTYNILKTYLTAFTVNARIVATRVTHPAIRSSHYTRLKRVLRDVEIRSGRIIEDKNGIK